jgi:hypothetical protein
LKKFICYGIIIISISLGIVFILSLVQPFLYSKFPSDNDRHLVIMDVLNRSEGNNNILVFGDSRTMYGVDTRIIRDDLDLPCEVFNLASTGQNIFESSYFYGLLDSNTRAVIQCTSPDFFSKDMDHHLSTEKALSMFLSGYRINESTRSLINNYNEIFDGNKFINYLKSRSVIRSYLHSNILRPLLDNEIFDQEAKYSHYFPHVHTALQHRDYPFYPSGCENYKSKEKPESQLSFLIDARRYFESKGIEYFIVLMPVNSDECEECYEDFIKYENMIEQLTNIRVINLTDLLMKSRYFYDAMHPNLEGAKIVSSEIAGFLKTTDFGFD